MQVSRLAVENMELTADLSEMRHTCYVQQQEIEEYKRQLWKRTEEYYKNVDTQPLDSSN